jgi:hypothetical protein
MLPGPITKALLVGAAALSLGNAFAYESLGFKPDLDVNGNCRSTTDTTPSSPYYFFSAQMVGGTTRCGTDSNGWMSFRISGSAYPFASWSVSALTGKINFQSFVMRNSTANPLQLTITSGAVTYTKTAPVGISTIALDEPITNSSTVKITFSAADIVGAALQSVSVEPFIPLSISPSTLPSPQVGSLYSRTLTATGGLGAPYTFALQSGALPAGLELDPATGTISGTPTAAGSTSFTIRVTDSKANTLDRSYTLNPIKIPEPQAATVTATPTAVAVGETTTLALSGGIGNAAPAFQLLSGPCTVSGNQLTGTATGTCVVRGTKASSDPLNYAAATGTVSVTVLGLTQHADGTSRTQFTQGQPNGTCTFRHVAFTSALPGPLPAGFTAVPDMPRPVLEFETRDCTVGDTLTMQVTHADVPAGAVLLKWKPLATPAQWVKISSFNGGTASYTVTDGGDGDDDGAQDGAILDPVVVAMPAAAATTTAVPTLSQWCLIAMSALLALFGMTRMRRRQV